MPGSRAPAPSADAQALHQPPDGRGKARFAHRLHQVVVRFGVERTNRELVVRGQEHHRGHPLRRPPPNDLEAVDLGHLDVEEEHVRPHARRARASTSRPSRHSPTMVNSGKAASSCRTPRRAAGSSSATSTLHLALRIIRRLQHDFAKGNPETRDRALRRGGRHDQRGAIAVERAQPLARVLEAVARPPARRPRPSARRRRPRPTAPACRRRAAPSPTTRPASVRLAIPCRSAFSTRCCRAKRGTAARERARGRCRTPAAGDRRTGPARPPDTAGPAGARLRARPRSPACGSACCGARR